MTIHVFDTSVLSPFARANRLATLRTLFPNGVLLTTPAVRQELANGAPQYPTLNAALTVEWLGTTPPMEDNLIFLSSFAGFHAALGDGARNVGEATVLAYASVVGGVAVIDENPAANLGIQKGIAIVRTLGQVAMAVTNGILDGGQAASLVDDLINVGGARFPCTGATLLEWLRVNGQVD